MSVNLRKSIQPLENLLKLIWFGQFLSLGIYVFLGFKRASNMGVAAEELSPLVPILGFCGATVLLISFALRWFTLSLRAISKVASGGVPKWFNYISGQSNLPSSVFTKEPAEELSEPENNLLKYAKKLFPIVLIQWGCAHTVALYGMIVPSPQPLSVIVGAIVTAVAMFFHFPNIRTRFAAGLELAEFERGMNRNVHA